MELDWIGIYLDSKSFKIEEYFDEDPVYTAL